MIAILLAAASAAVYGAADYCGGVATRRAPVLAVTLISQLAGVPLLLILAGAVAPGTPDGTDLAWGAAAGIAGLSGLVLLYRGLASGAMTVVAPVTAVTAALVPMMLGLATGERPRPSALIGAGCAILAIGLVSLAPAPAHAEDTASGAESAGRTGGAATVGPVIMALVAGAAFGLFFAMLDLASPQAGLWPLATARGASLGLGVVAAVTWYLWIHPRWDSQVSLRRVPVENPVLVAAAASTTRAAPATQAAVATTEAEPLHGAGIRTRTRFRMSRAVLTWTITAGLLDMAANALYLLATQRGMLSVVAPITTLYPAGTVILALLVDAERLRPVQIAGLGFAALALLLVAGAA